jgi:glycosyltransferase involved in cell wall biosynthesis
VPMLGYFEFYYQAGKADVGFDPEFPTGPQHYLRIRARNAINHIALSLNAAGQTPTEWQLSTYPEWAHSDINLIWEGVNLDVCRPSFTRATMSLGAMTISPSDQLVTYVARDLEPYRGFHILMRALPKLLQRKDVKVAIIGGDGVSYGSPPPQCTWRDVLLAEVGDRIDASRVVFTGRVSYDLYRAVLSRSDAHIYLTYPFVASWSLREAFAIGCPIIGSDTEPVREFIADGHNGLLVPFLDPAALADTVLDLLEQPLLSRALRTEARKYAEQHLAMSDSLAYYDAVIERLTGTKIRHVEKPRVSGRNRERHLTSPDIY